MATAESDTEAQIREAAFRALATHGYADLSIKDIGAELGRNPAIIYHYFESKDDLLLSMLQEYVDLFVAAHRDGPIDDPGDALREFIGEMVHPSPHVFERAMTQPPVDPELAASRVYVELWAHAMWDDAFRETTTRVEERLRTTLRELIEAGIESGDFETEDPARTADHLYFLVNQAMHVRAATDRSDATARVEAIVEELIEDLHGSG